MPTNTYSRRRMLRGILATGGAVAVPLPIFDGLLNGNGTAFAAGMPLPRRFVSWFFGNGILPPRWVPTATGDTWELSEQLAPLVNVKDYLTVISGLARKVGGGAHPGGAAGAVTGSQEGSGGAQKPSIDQIAVDVLAGNTPFKSLEVGVTNATPNGTPLTLHSVSFRGPNQVLYPEFDPKAVFTRIFATASIPGGATPSTGTMPPVATAASIDKLLAVKRSVLDSVLADAKDLSATLGAQDRMRLAAHLDGIRSLEARLTPATGTGATGAMGGAAAAGGTTTCAKPLAPTRGPDATSEAPPEVNTIMADLTTMALACGLTNVATFTFSLPAAHVYYRHLGATMNDDFHNNICHTEAGDATGQPRVHQGVLYAMRCLAEFLEKMKAVGEGAGNLLGSSLVYVTSCTAWGKVHGTDDWPVLMVGKASGRLKGNQHFKYPGENLSRALLTAANIVGSPLTELGKSEGLVTAALPGIQIA
jgi:hypothetical protein